MLYRQRNLLDFKVGRLFLRDDVPPDHKLRQCRLRPPNQNALLSLAKVQVTSRASTGTFAVSSDVALNNGSPCRDGSNTPMVYMRV